MIIRPWLIALLLSGAVAGCTEGSPTVPADQASSAVAITPVPGLSLPADPLARLVPAPDEVPAAMVPLLTASGRRDAAAIAGFSSDATAAAAALAEHGFAGAYVAQYADPSTPRVLSVVVVRFATPEGATADLDSDDAVSSGELVPASSIGTASQLRRQPLPGGGELLTLRFRKGATTWLLAYGNRPTADVEVALRLGRLLAGRG
ncbi:MAG: hypothetical protein H7323_10765 [Frankiales bacterium]|nr:hypothetical protein [Frankiales bacterium]